MALLGSLILDPDKFNDVLLIIPSSGFFFAESHGAIFDALASLYEHNQSGDLVQLVSRLQELGQLDQLGGPEYLVRLAESTPTAVNAPYYAKIVRSKYQLRKLLDISHEIIYDVHTLDPRMHVEEHAQQALDRAEQRVFEINEESSYLEDQTLGQLLQERLDYLEQNEGRTITGVASNYLDLDDMTSGLQNGELVIVAARPSMGKTALALNLAEQIAFGGSPYEKDPKTPIGFFSMEMSKASLAQRLLCSRAQVDSQKVRRNQLNKEEFGRLMDAAAELSEAPIFIDDTPALSVTALRAKARRMVSRHDVKCLFVDYLQLMSSPGSAGEGRQQEVSSISRGIKALSRELNVPIVCLAQLNRGAEQREGHRPRMADLRESGSIEQDADMIVLLHREEYYHVGDREWLEDPDNAEKIGLAELIIAKQRNGPTGVVKLTWDNKTTRFKNHQQAAGAYRAYEESGSGGHGAGSGYGGSGGSGYGGASGAAFGGSPGAGGGGAAAGGVGAVGEPKRVAFAPGSKSGPAEDHRDGGGPDADEDLGDLPI